MTQQQSRFTEIDARTAKSRQRLRDVALSPGDRETPGIVRSNLEVPEFERAIVKDAVRKAQNEEFTGDAESSRLGVSSDRAKLMSALSIAYDGRRCYRGPFRYDKLESVDYAKRRQARVVSIPRKAPAMCSEPSDADRELMNAADVISANGVYHFGEYRYDKLAHALAHARLTAVRDTASKIP